MIKLLIKIKVPIEGQVNLTFSAFYCCSQSKWFIIYIDEQDFYLFKDKDKLSFYLKIPLNTILGVNKCQLVKADINTFSIYYKRNELTNEVTELKLKAINKREMIDWIYKIRLVLNSNKFDFQIGRNQVHCDNYLRGLFPHSKHLFISINLIEFIIKKQLMLKIIWRLMMYWNKRDDENKCFL